MAQKERNDLKIQDTYNNILSIKIQNCLILKYVYTNIFRNGTLFFYKLPTTSIISPEFSTN